METQNDLVFEKESAFILVLFVNYSGNSLNLNLD
jgi:hypothetical protein